MNKKRIEFLELKIKSLKGTIEKLERNPKSNIVVYEEGLKFFEEWLEDLKSDEWIDGKIKPKEDARYLCRCKSTNDNYLIDVAQFSQGEWHISNNWDLIEYRKIPKGSDEQ